MKLVLTLTKDVAINREILASANMHGIADIIENHGELSPREIDHLYRTLHVFVFPSLCESFGFPMVEAMAYGIPLLVADIDSNIEVAGSGAESFSPYDPESLALMIEKLVVDGRWFRCRARSSLVRGTEFKWDRAAAATVSLMEAVMV